MALIDELLRARRFQRPSNIDVNRRIVQDEIIEQERKRKIQEEFDRMLAGLTEKDALASAIAERSRTGQAIAEAEGIPRGGIARLPGNVFTNINPETGANLIGATPSRTITPEALRELATAPITSEAVQNIPGFADFLTQRRTQRETLAADIEQQRIASEGGIREAEITAEAKGSITSEQAKVRGFAKRATHANNALQKLYKVIDPKSFQFAKESLSPFSARSETFQQKDSAEKEFLASVLRRESGAQITDFEFDFYSKIYFPRFNESKKSLKQKQEARQLAVEGLREEGVLPPVESLSDGLRSESEKQLGKDAARQQLEIMAKDITKPNVRKFIQSNLAADKNPLDILDALKERGLIE